MSKRKELEAARKKREQRQTTTMLVVIGIIALVLIGGAIILVNANNNRVLAPIVANNDPAPANAEANGRAWGPKDAPIKIVEWLDYQCPACKAFANTYEKSIQTAFAGTGKVRYEIRSMSFIGDESVRAAQASMCAADQNLFWQMHSSLYLNQPQTERSGEWSNDRLKAIAAQITGMDTAAFNSCLDSGKHAQEVSAEQALGPNSGVQATPTFIINGKLYTNLLKPEDFRKVFAQIAPTVQLGN